MPVTLITIGPALTMVQNEAYALPARRVLARVTGAIETSQDNSTWAAVTTTNLQAELAAVFVRSTASGTIITLKAM